MKLTYHGYYDYNVTSNKIMDALKEVIQIKLLQRLREQESETYSPSATVAYKKIPEQQFSLSISFECAPENVNKLVKAATAEINNIKKVRR